MSKSYVLASFCFVLLIKQKQIAVLLTFSSTDSQREKQPSLIARKSFNSSSINKHVNLSLIQPRTECRKLFYLSCLAYLLIRFCRIIGPVSVHLRWRQRNLLIARVNRHAGGFWQLVNKFDCSQFRAYALNAWLFLPVAKALVDFVLDWMFVLFLYFKILASFVGLRVYKKRNYDGPISRYQWTVTPNPTLEDVRFWTAK